MWGVIDVTGRASFWIFTNGIISILCARICWACCYLYLLVPLLSHCSFTITLAIPPGWCRGYVTESHHTHLSVNLIKHWWLVPASSINIEIKFYKTSYTYVACILIKTRPLPTCMCIVPKTGLTSSSSPAYERRWSAILNHSMWPPFWICESGYTTVSISNSHHVFVNDKFKNVLLLKIMQSTKLLWQCFSFY